MFETLMGEATHFTDNILFLREHNLRKLFGHLFQADRAVRLKENKYMNITQQQLDDLKQTDQELSDAITAALTRSQQAQSAAQEAAADLAAANAKITALQTQLDDAGTPADLSGILSDLKGAKDKVNGIDVTLAPTTGSTPAVGVGDTVTVATDPTDPSSDTADHTVTDVSPDGTTSTEPVAPTEEQAGQQEQGGQEQGGQEQGEDTQAAGVGDGSTSDAEGAVTTI